MGKSKSQRRPPQTPANDKFSRRAPKACPFCKDGTKVDWKDLATIKRYVSDRGKIRARRVTGACVQHQNDVAAAVKVARELALIPYLAR